jgi:ribosome-associated toxin RatA of RatAB toxin-antitoxin module
MSRNKGSEWGLAEGKMAESGTEAIEIDATPERILEVVADIESYPSWMPAFKKAVVVERDDKGRPLKAEFELDAMIKRLRYVLRYSYPKKGVSWEKVEGDVKEIKGSYSLAPRGDSTKVTYSYTLDPGFSVPGFLLKQGVRMMVSSALNDLKKRAEES